VATFYLFYRDSVFDGIPASTVYRRAIEWEEGREGISENAVFYRDDLGWFSDDFMLRGESALFERATGISPFFVIISTIEGEVTEELDTIYASNFSDGRGLVIMVHDDGEAWEVFYKAGEEASEIFDEEASEIFKAYLNKFDTVDYSDVDWLAYAIRETQTVIMSFIPHWMYWSIIVTLGIMVLYVVYIVVGNKFTSKKKLMLEMEAFLDAPIAQEVN
jgi:hypothetical protein